MVNSKKLKILHLLSQRPDSTGSGIYVQAMIREATACGYDNFLVAGVRSDRCDTADFIAQDQRLFVKFHNGDVSYHIPGMSDVMPYESTRFVRHPNALRLIYRRSRINWTLIPGQEYLKKSGKRI